MSINKQLSDLYQKHWNNLLEENEKNKTQLGFLTYPVLLKVKEEEYTQATVKVVIFGQEVKGWAGTLGDNKYGVNSLMAEYERFFINEEFYDGYGTSKFWQAFRYFTGNINQELAPKNVSYVWSNITKIGREGEVKTGTTPEICELLKSFPVIHEEIQILKPDVVLFLTGSRDGDIETAFPDATFEQVSDLPMFANVKATGLPKASYRMYHPAAYQFTNDYQEKVLEEIIKGYKQHS